MITLWKNKIHLRLMDGILKINRSMNNIHETIYNLFCWQAFLEFCIDWYVVFFCLILNRFLSRDIHWGVTCGTRKQIIFNSSAWQLLFVYFARSPHNSNLHGIHVMVAPELPNYNWQFTKGDSIHCTPRQIQHGFHSGLSPSLYCWNVKKLVVVC